MGNSGLSLLICSSIVLTIFLISGMSFLPAQATSSSDISNPEQDAYEWNTITGEDLLNDPTAIKILENIEIAKQRIVQLQNPQVILTEQQKYINEQRRISQEILQEQLDRMYKEKEDFTPKAAFAKYVAKKPEFLHGYYWELFDYLQDKIGLAEQERDKILQNGGSVYEARQVYFELASMTRDEMFWTDKNAQIKHGLLNMVSSKADFEALPTETLKAFEAYWKKKNLGPSNIPILEYQGQGELAEVTPSAIEPTEQNGSIFKISTDVIDDAATLNLQSDDTSLNLTGDVFVTPDMVSMDSMSELTLSAWVKPEYNVIGSFEYAILSKGGTFTLSINNNISPKQVAKFTIFDGIKWTVIESSSVIPEDKWTHLAATLDDSTISLYVNGQLEATTEIAGIPTMNSRGFLEAKTLESLSSESEILIGAEQLTSRSNIKSRSFFSGQIDQVVIEDKLLDGYQISELCIQSEHYSA